MSEQQTALDSELVELKTAISDAATRIQAKLDALTAQIAAGSTPVDLTAELSDLRGDIDMLKGLGADAPVAPSP